MRPPPHFASCAGPAFPGFTNIVFFFTWEMKAWLWACVSLWLVGLRDYKRWVWGVLKVYQTWKGFFVDLCVLSDSNVRAKSTAKYACLAKYSHECLGFSAFNKKIPNIFFMWSYLFKLKKLAPLWRRLPPSWRCFCSLPCTTNFKALNPLHSTQGRLKSISIWEKNILCILSPAKHSPNVHDDD